MGLIKFSGAVTFLLYTSEPFKTYFDLADHQF